MLVRVLGLLAMSFSLFLNPFPLCLLPVKTTMRRPGIATVQPRRRFKVAKSMFVFATLVLGSWGSSSETNLIEVFSGEVLSIPHKVRILNTKP